MRSWRLSCPIFGERASQSGWLSCRAPLALVYIDPFRMHADPFIFVVVCASSPLYLPYLVYPAAGTCVSSHAGDYVSGSRVCTTAVLCYLPVLALRTQRRTLLFRLSANHGSFFDLIQLHSSLVDSNRSLVFFRLMRRQQSWRATSTHCLARVQASWWTTARSTTAKKSTGEGVFWFRGWWAEE